MEEALHDLLAHEASPSFVYLHHPHHPTSSVPLDAGTECRIAQIDAIEYHTPRLFYSGVLYRLGSDAGEVATWDEFTIALRSLNTDTQPGPSKSRKGKAAVRSNGHTNGISTSNGNHGTDGRRDRVIIIVTHAERLRTVIGGNWAVLTRLAEMTGVSATVVLASSIPWDEMRPQRADAPEPVHLYLPPSSRDEIFQQLATASSHPLFTRFLELILSTFMALVTAPAAQLEDLAEALWPVYTSILPPHSEQTLLQKPYPDPDNPPPPLHVNIKLLTDLKHHMSIPLAAAIEDLLPGTTGRREFTRSMLDRPNATTYSPSRHKAPSGGLAGRLPLCAKYILVAAYCASYNPAKSDLRLFGRVSADGKRKRGGGTRRAGYGRTRIGKIPQRLLGPRPFPLDRVLALFASLYAEHAERPEDLQLSPDELYSSGSDGEEEDDWGTDVERARKRAEGARRKEVELDEMWEDEVEHLTMSVNLWSMIPELESQGLLRRMSPVDRLDNIMLRCEVEYEEVKSLAKELKITLDEYLYEATL